jgi:hypothetical protein
VEILVADVEEAEAMDHLAPPQIPIPVASVRCVSNQVIQQTNVIIALTIHTMLNTLHQLHSLHMSMLLSTPLILFGIMTPEQQIT